MIIALSDVHLGYSESNRDSFEHFVDNYLKNLRKGDQLVLMGDILEFWRTQNVTTLLENEGIISKLAALDADVYYLPGNHDYSIYRFSKQRPDKYPFKVSKSIHLQSGGKSFHFTHGYELEVLATLEPITVEQYEQLSDSMCQMTDAVLGRLLSTLWDEVKAGSHFFDQAKKNLESLRASPNKRLSDIHENRICRLAMSDAKGIFLECAQDETLIFGHTHMPFESRNAFNTGAWVKDGEDYNTFVEITDGVARLCKYDE